MRSLNLTMAKMSKEVIWLDVDGVLLDYVRPFFKFADLPITYEELPTYNFLNYFESPKHGVDKMRDFCNSDVFANLDPIADPVLLASLKNAGYELRIITQLVGEPFARINRIKNLTRLFGPIFSEVIFTEAGQCKLDILRQKNATENGHFILIEDNPKLLLKADSFFDSWENIEVHAVLHPYNREDLKRLLNVKSKDTFDHIAEELLERKTHYYGKRNHNACEDVSQSERLDTASASN